MRLELGLTHAATHVTLNGALLGWWLRLVQLECLHGSIDANC